MNKKDKFSFLKGLSSENFNKLRYLLKKIKDRQELTRESPEHNDVKLPVSELESSPDVPNAQEEYDLLNKLERENMIMSLRHPKRTAEFFDGIEDEENKQTMFLPSKGKYGYFMTTPNFDKLEQFISNSPKETDEKSFYFDDKTFKIRLNDGSFKAINLVKRAKKEGTDSYYLLFVLAELLNLKGTRTTDGWLCAKITQKDIFDNLWKAFDLRKDQQWLKTAKSNLIQVISSQAGPYIEFSSYDPSQGYYLFKIKNA